MYRTPGASQRPRRSGSQGSQYRQNVRGTFSLTRRGTRMVSVQRELTRSLSTPPGGVRNQHTEFTSSHSCASVAINVRCSQHCWAVTVITCLSVSGDGAACRTLGRRPRSAPAARPGSPPPGRRTVLPPSPFLGRRQSSFPAPGQSSVSSAGRRGQSSNAPLPRPGRPSLHTQLAARRSAVRRRGRRSVHAQVSTGGRSVQSCAVFGQPRGQCSGRQPIPGSVPRPAHWTQW